jgi:hypothetical protein
MSLGEWLVLLLLAALVAVVLLATNAQNLPLMNPGSHPIQKHGTEAHKAWRVVNEFLSGNSTKTYSCGDDCDLGGDLSGTYDCGDGSVLEVVEASNDKYSIVWHNKPLQFIITAFTTHSRKYVQNKIDKCIW